MPWSDFWTYTGQVVVGLLILAGAIAGGIDLYDYAIEKKKERNK